MNRHSGPKRRPVVIHDAHGLKNFWEEIIEAHTKQREVEDSRITRSALNKLRREWTQRLEGRIKMLQKTSEKSKVQSSLLPIETFQPIHKTAA
ncbi:protein FAM240B [Pogona vitticeps]|uniref:Protein FAM240B-like n=1 Tax=Pogona vitticeps TaxID=103695 RepID=A0ABM5FSR9_9SAUR